ncbi:hypothetical protein [Streptomyces lushanensis]|uniref:hypothetical protein n=1 Tax=Streptomyces lushanensis TaxID=1434255 RepID=UPI001B8068F6|nr:hypothetical protein [Streptomyces lushanensis]
MAERVVRDGVVGDGAEERRERPPVGAFARPDVVPYIARWSSERCPPSMVAAGDRGIRYTDELPHDRDARGILWKRIGLSPGKGRPEFGNVHFFRQRRAMRKLLCQICGGPADRTADGTLWLVGEDADDRDAWATDLVTGHPPLCVPCAVTSVRACPHLRKQYVALRVRTFELGGVQGALYRLYGRTPVAYSADGVPFHSWRIHWVLAAQLLMSLAEFTMVDLAEEHAQYMRRKATAGPERAA